MADHQWVSSGFDEHQKPIVESANRQVAITKCSLLSTPKTGK